MKKCFTINPLRTTDDFLGYQELIKKNIYQAIEIFYPYNLDLNKQTIYTNNIHDLITKFPFLEVVLHLPHGPKHNLCNLDEYQHIIQIMKEAMDYASLFNVKKLTLHLGYRNNDFERTFDINHIMMVLRDLCDYASKYQMVLMIENMPGIKEVGYGPYEILSIIQNVGKNNLKFIFDTGHAHVSEFNDEDYIYILKDFLYHIHYNDNHGIKDEHQRIGSGTIDFKKIAKALKTVDYQELHCMEVLFEKSEELSLFAQDLDHIFN